MVPDGKIKKRMREKKNLKVKKKVSPQLEQGREREYRDDTCQFLSGEHAPSRSKL